MHIPNPTGQLARLLILLLVLLPLLAPPATASHADADPEMAMPADCASGAERTSCADDGTGCSQHCAAALGDLPSAPAAAGSPAPFTQAPAPHLPLEERLRPPIA